MKLSTIGYGVLAVAQVRHGIASSSCPTVDSTSLCPQGCWHASGIIFSDGSRRCEPVGRGYFSPQNDDLRHLCDPGSFSNIEMAGACVSCPAGTHASRAGMDECHVCPSSTYSGMPRSTTCMLCDPTFYNGDGANSIQEWNGNIYCVLSTPAPAETGRPTPSPLSSATLFSTFVPTLLPTSRPPTVSPTQLPSELPTTGTTEPPTSEPTAFPTNHKAPSTSASASTPLPTLAAIGPTIPPAGSPSLRPSIFTGDVDGNSTLGTFPIIAGSCSSGEYEWHGTCRQCPSQVSAMLHPLWIFLFLVCVMISLYHLPPCCIDIFWLGLEYLQFLYLLGLAPLEWSGILQRTYGIISIFALDLDAAFSLQCQIGIFDVSPSLEQVWILTLPILVWIALCAISKFLSAEELPTTRWMVIAFYLGHAKLLLTSLEAIRCPESWFCRDQLFASTVGTIGLVVYGVGFPLWFQWNLRLSSSPNSQQTWMHKTFPFQATSRWWWTGFWMVRKSVIVILMVIFYDESPTIILTTLLVALMLSEVLQRAQPTPGATNHSGRNTSDKCNSAQGGNTNETSSKHRRKWFQTPNVDLTLQSCLILLTAVSFVSFAVSAEKGLGLGILFLIVFIPSMIYWIVALFHCRFSCHCDSDKKKKEDEPSDGGGMGSKCGKLMSTSAQRPVRRTNSLSDEEAPEAAPERPKPPILPPFTIAPQPASTDYNVEDIETASYLENNHKKVVLASADNDCNTAAAPTGWIEMQKNMQEIHFNNGTCAGSDNYNAIDRHHLSTAPARWPETPNATEYHVDKIVGAASVRSDNDDGAFKRSTQRPRLSNNAALESVAWGEDDNSSDVIFDDDVSLSSSEDYEEDGQDAPSALDDDAEEEEEDDEEEEAWIEANGNVVVADDDDLSSAAGSHSACESEDEESVSDEAQQLGRPDDGNLRTRQWAANMGIDVINTHEITETHHQQVIVDNVPANRNGASALHPHRVEPSTWGQRQSAPYQPSNNY